MFEGFGSSLSPFVKGGVSLLARFSWVLWLFVPLTAIVFSIFLWKLLDQKKKQWTHRLIIRRVLADGRLTKPKTIKMRRFPLIKTGEIFELEKPLLGSYLIAELDAYTGENEYSIILDNNNRIYKNTGERFVPEKGSIEVSARHAEIDIALGELKQKYQQVHQTQKVTDWAKIGKFALWGLLIIAIMVVSIKAIEQWGNNQQAMAQAESAQAEAFTQLKEAMQIIDGTAKTQVYILDKLKEIEGNNIQTKIRKASNEND